MCVCVCVCVRARARARTSVTWLITWGGGGELTVSIRNFVLQRSKFERGENWSRKMQHFYFLFSVYFLFAAIKFSNPKKYSYVEKILGRAFPPLPPKLRPLYVCACVCVYVCVCVYIYVCVCVYIYIYIYI
jgi:hypothetical protein